MYLKKQKTVESGVSWEINDITGVRFNSLNMKLSVDTVGFLSAEKRAESMGNSLQGSSVTDEITLEKNSTDQTMQELVQAYVVFKEKLFNHMLTLPTWEGGTIQQG
jgi:hypothetical protein